MPVIGGLDLGVGGAGMADEFARARGEVADQPQQTRLAEAPRLGQAEHGVRHLDSLLASAARGAMGEKREHRRPQPVEGAHTGGRAHGADAEAAGKAEGQRQQRRVQVDVLVAVEVAHVEARVADARDLGLHLALELLRPYLADEHAPEERRVAAGKAAARGERRQGLGRRKGRLPDERQVDADVEAVLARGGGRLGEGRAARTDRRGRHDPFAVATEDPSVDPGMETEVVGGDDEPALAGGHGRRTRRSGPRRARGARRSRPGRFISVLGRDTPAESGIVQNRPRDPEGAHWPIHRRCGTVAPLST
jgi:hypothetical protein